MSNVWSTCIQGIETLYLSRQLRFDDRFSESYMRAFDINNAASILEIGAGPGALAEALNRWYPAAKITGSDRDATIVKVR